jgi:carbonic anhydrase
MRDMLKPDEALKKLLEGNRRFVNGEMPQARTCPTHRKNIIDKQEPFAVVITCSDSRVCPEIIMDCGLGDIFVVRVAAGALNPDLLGTIEYAILALNVKLILMLGHDNCGVMECILRDKADLSDDVKKLCDHVSRNFSKEDKKALSASEGAKVATLEDVKLLKKIPVLKQKIKEKELKVIPAHYNFYTNEIELLEMVDGLEFCYAELEKV